MYVYKYIGIYMKPGGLRPNKTHIYLRPVALIRPGLGVSCKKRQKTNALMLSFDYAGRQRGKKEREKMPGKRYMFYFTAYAE